MNVFKKIKKQNSERFAKTLRNYHNGIFEIPDVVEIVKHAGREVQDAEAILQYLISLLTESEDPQNTEVQDPFELLREAGYVATYADTLEKQNAIKPFFTSSEELCTFKDSSRFKNYFILNCVHETARTLSRQDFKGKEERQDAYGVSVISIQIAKRGGFISIKNRYNHTVKNCDNTFNSDPDRIIKGLSAALQKHFNVEFSGKQSTPEGFVLVGKKLVKVNYEINGIFFGDHCYVTNGKLVEMKDHEYLFDYFLFDVRTRRFSCIGSLTKSSFVEAFNSAYGGSPTVYVKKHCIYDGDTLLVGV